MKSNKEYKFRNNIESVDDVITFLQSAGYAVTLYRKCDLDGWAVNYRLVFSDLAREYEISGTEDCLRLIVNDGVLLGEMLKAGAIVEA